MKEQPPEIETTVELVDIEAVPPAQAKAMRQTRQLFARLFAETEEKEGAS